MGYNDEPACADCGGEVGIAPDGTAYKRCMACNAKRKKAAPPAPPKAAPRAAAPTQPFKADPVKLEAEAKRSAQVRRQACINSTIAYYAAKGSNAVPATVPLLIKTAEELEKWVMEAKS